MVKAIIFDCWGTLVEQGVRSPIKQVKDLLNITLPFSEYVVRMQHAMMTKQQPLQEAFSQVMQEFNVPVNEDKIEELVGMWNKNWMLAEPYEEVNNMLETLKENYQLILISNTGLVGVNNVLDKFDLRKHFDHVFISCEMGKIKTDEDFFPTIIKQLELNAEDCVVVGDSLQSDIIAAKQHGLQAVLIDRRNTRNFPKKITSLTQLPEFL